MEHWTLAVCRTRRGSQYYLTNRARTLIRIKRRLRFSPVELFVRLQELGVPSRITNGLDEIYFTNLRGSLAGWYLNDKITIDVTYGRWDLDDIVYTTIHEMAHHLDEQEGITAHGHLTEERIKKGRFLAGRRNSNTTDDDGEYLATGFEEYYAGGPKARRILRTRHPRLYWTISRIDRIYRSDHS